MLKAIASFIATGYGPASIALGMAAIVLIFTILAN